MSPLEVKNTVAVIAWHPAIRYACDVVEGVWRRKLGVRAVITSAQDSTHSDSSLHYGKPGDIRCRAIDIRIQGIEPIKLDTAVADLKRRLGPDFDVVVEVDHVHIEYDPKV